MKILICGGDGRYDALKALLRRDGHEVLRFCAERADITAPERADVVILPSPAESGCCVNAPKGVPACRTENILDAAGEGALILGGGMSASLREKIASRGQRGFDYMRLPSYTAKNAAITAEGAVSELMRESDRALCDMDVLIIGWGRIGKMLISKLRALCRSVSLLSASAQSRALARELGCASYAPGEELMAFDAVINTAPAQIVPELEAFKQSCLIFELASAPGGFPPDERVRILRSLPGRYAPDSAAAALYAAVNEILRGVEK